MTVKDIKELFGIKPKISIPDDYIVTNEDVIKGNIFQRFNTNGTLIGTINGLSVINDDINYVYVLINNIEIETDDFFPACGGEQPITTYANYSLCAINSNGDDKVIESGKKSAVTPLITLNNALFSYVKPNLINKKPNNSDINNEVDILASYYSRGKKYEATKHVIQHINSYSSWLIESEPTTYITLTLSNNNISNKGGISTAKVERCYSKIYYMKDSCGNKVGGKSEPGLIEDITNKCLITSSNRKEFSPNKNVILVKEQEIGAKQRSATITARYLDFTDSVELYQNEGGVVSYTYSLLFDNEKSIKYIPLETSLPTTIDVYLYSKKDEYIDGEFHNEIENDKLTVYSEDSWVKGFVTKDENGVKAVISTTEINADRENDREASLIIYCSEDKNTNIKLIISQPAMDVVKEIYNCEYIGKSELNSNEVDKCGVSFNIYKTLVYEDGKQVIAPVDDTDVIKYYFSSDNNELLEMIGLEKTGSTEYCAKFLNKTKYSVSDIGAKIVANIYSNDNDKIYESEPMRFTVKGTDIISNTYDLSFSSREDKEIITWKNSEKPTLIRIISIKNTYKNGKLTGTEFAPYKVGLYDKNGNEQRNYDFSIQLTEDGILAFPLGHDKNVYDTFIITQKETGKKLTLILSHLKKEERTFNVPITVTFKADDNINEEIWTGENSFLIIDNKINLNLSPCWISPNMEEKTDVAYTGKIELKEGYHLFEIYNAKCLSIGKSSSIDYSKRIMIDSDNPINIEVDI